MMTTINRDRRARSTVRSTKTDRRDRSAPKLLESKFTSFKTTKSGMQVRKLNIPIKVEDYTEDELVKIMTRIHAIVTEDGASTRFREKPRESIRVLVRKTFSDQPAFYMDIKNLINYVSGYQDEGSYADFDKKLDIIKIEHLKLPMTGGCDTREHKVTDFFFDSENIKQKIVYKSLKSSGNNCLITIFGKIAGVCIKSLALRKQLGWPADTPLEPEKADILSDKYSVSYRMFHNVDGQIQLLRESPKQFEKTVDIYLSLNHYFVIEQLPADILRFKPKISIAETTNIETNAERTVLLGEEQKQEIDPDNIYQHEIHYHQVLNNPTLEQIQDLVKNSDKHILIFGQAGVGKTYISKRLQQVTMTATTGIASTHLNGDTIHRTLKEKFKGTEKNILIDECSMLSDTMFEEIMTINKEMKLKKRFILVGDLLQMPPIDESFFFQTYEFVKFAKNCIRINLTEIKRQDKRDQQEFLNKARIGEWDFEYLKSIYNNKVENAQVIIAPTNAICSGHNTQGIDSLSGDLIKFQTTFKYDQSLKDVLKNKLKKYAKDYPDVGLKVGAKVMLNSNIDVKNGLVNGAIGFVEKIDQNSVDVKFSFGVRKIQLIDQQEGSVKITYMPLTIAYAVTIHKAQGCTFQSAHLYTNDMFETGQMYVGLSRVQDLNNLQCIGQTPQFVTKAMKPNQIAYDFVYKNLMITRSEQMFIKHADKQLKGITIKEWKKPELIWNHIYLDFETGLKKNVQKPYYNKIIHHKKGKTIYQERLFDQRWDGGVRCKVADQTWDYVKKVMIDHGNNLYSLKQNKKSGDSKSTVIYKSEKQLIPTIIAYNGSGFDFNFILKRFLNDKTCSKRFEIKNIFKGSSLIFFQVFDRKSGEIVLRSHDLCQVLNCSLGSALTNFCKDNQTAQQIAKKIDFKDEILYIMNNYFTNPKILAPGVKSTITQRLYTSNGILEKEIKKDICLYDEVIKYADNDTDVLPILYKCLDELTKNCLNCNITSFLTAGSMAWYGAIVNLPQEALENNKYDNNRNKNKHIDTKLFRLEKKEADFTKNAVKGGRVCPRVHKIEKDSGKHVYLDISGMYVSIMKNEIFPYGKSKWFSQEEITDLLKFTQQQVRIGELDQYKKVFNKLTEKYGLFVAQCDFEENQNNLEPVIQYKHNGLTKYTLQRRTDAITSLDLALIIASGGKVYNITKVLGWQKQGKILSGWMQKTLEIKNEGQRTGNSGMKSFGKLLGNSTYGQTLKQDKNEVLNFINTFEEADNFVTENQMTGFFEMDEYDIYIGKKKVDNETFITSRCLHIGAFVLAYTRAMLYEICEVAMPNRYNKKGLGEMPVYGDTDSLVFKEWQAHLLIKSGWVKFENGRLTDELGEKSHWFLPKQYIKPIENLNMFQNLPFDEGLKLEEQQEMIWSQATESEKRDPSNFFFYYVTEGIFASPKSYACKYTDHCGKKSNDKMKFKGIPTTALIGDQKLDFKLIYEAYTNPSEPKVAILQSKPQVIKNFSKREGERMFLEIVDSNLRRDAFNSRQLFKTKWQGRFHLDDNVTVPYGWNGQNELEI